MKITANIFHAKIYSRVNILKLKNTVLRNRVCSVTTCLFHSETTKYWCVAWKYVFLLDVLNKKENIINAGYWVLSKNLKNYSNFQREKPICPNRKN